MTFDYWLAQELCGAPDGLASGTFDYWLSGEQTFDLTLSLLVAFMTTWSRYW